MHVCALNHKVLFVSRSMQCLPTGCTCTSELLGGGGGAYVLRMVLFLFLANILILCRKES